MIEGERSASVAQVIADRYELEQMVGAGGMSRVYRARDRTLERVVALKLLHEHYAHDDDYVERFRREARAVAQLSHPGIVTVIDRGDDEGKPFIVFEYVEGENLHELLQRTGALSIRQVLELGGEVARALAFAHEHGLVHRDVKPQNVILDRDGRAKVTDFGIARSLGVDHGVTQTGMVLGTSAYISPEQARGEPADACSDIYSLGAVLFELLTGQPPFVGESFVAVAMQHVSQPAPSILERRPDCPLRLAHAIERSLGKTPQERFPSMAAFAAELEACLGQLGTEPELDATLIRPAPPISVNGARTRRPRGSNWRAPLLVGLALVLLLGTGVGAYLLLRDSGGNASPPPAAAAGPVHLVGAGALDPFGPGNREHPERVADATDGNPATYWETETYKDGLNKQGVGLVVQTSSARALRSITVSTTTPGFTAEIRTATSADGAAQPGPADSGSQTVEATTTFRLNGKRSSYWVVWITSLGPNHHVYITEVKATG
jgi:eukaryotic-like serine/threonine-protein kinase